MRLIVASLLCLVALPSVSSGAIVTLSTGDSAIGGRARNQGWWSNLDDNSAGNTDIQTGSEFVTGVGVVENRSFFTFDLNDPGLSGATINSATLRVALGANAGIEASETIELFDVSTAAATLNTTGPVNSTIFTDLGSGTSFGSTTFNTSGAATDLIDFSLNADGLAALVSAIGAGGGGTNYFSIGAVLTSSTDDFVFTSVSTASTLVIDFTAVPEPGAVTLLALASAAGAFVRRRRS